jgi:hypothetical protein
LNEPYLKPTGNEITHEVKSQEIIKIEKSNTRLDLSLFISNSFPSNEGL